MKLLTISLSVFLWCQVAQASCNAADVKLYEQYVDKMTKKQSSGLANELDVKKAKVLLARAVACEAETKLCKKQLDYVESKLAQARISNPTNPLGYDDGVLAEEYVRVKRSCTN